MLLFLAVFVILFVLCIINTLARCSTVAVSDAWLKQTAEDGNKKAKSLVKLLEKSSGDLISGLEAASVIMGMLFFVVSTYGAYRFISSLGILTYIKATEPVALRLVLTSIAILTALVIVWLIYFVFVLMLPKRIAAKNADRFSLSLSGYSGMVSSLFRPFLCVASKASAALAKLFGVRDEDINEEVTEEEIRMMVDIGSESGAIDDDEKKMIHNIFEMDDKPVEDIMTHRTEADILWIEDNLDEWKKTIDETNHTRYPVCRESVDDVIGIVNSRDFYRFLLSGGDDVKTILRPVYFIPDTIKADELFSKMQSENEHMGIVMDEYGGFQGIVTQEDLIEEIVGELYSEYDEPEIIEDEEIEKIGEETWNIAGSAEIEDVENELDIKLPDGDYNTFAGFILDKLQTIPADGETLEIETNNLKIKITSVTEHRIDEAVVSVISRDRKDDDEEDATE